MSLGHLLYFFLVRIGGRVVLGERKGVGGEQGGVEGVEALVGMYCMRRINKN